MSPLQMLTCKQISQKLSKEDYGKLPLLKRLWIKFHIKCCLFCGKSNRQVLDSHEMYRYYKKQEHTLEPLRPKMDEQRKQQLKELLSDQSKKLHRTDSNSSEME